MQCVERSASVDGNDTEYDGKHQFLIGDKQYTIKYNNKNGKKYFSVFSRFGICNFSYMAGNSLLFKVTSSVVFCVAHREYIVY